MGSAPSSDEGHQRSIQTQIHSPHRPPVSQESFRNMSPRHGAGGGKDSKGGGLQVTSHSDEVADKTVHGEWEMQDELSLDHWGPLDAASSERIEDAFVNDKTEAQVVIARRIWKVDLKAFTIQAVNGKAHKIRRTVPGMAHHQTFLGDPFSLDSECHLGGIASGDGSGHSELYASDCSPYTSKLHATTNLHTAPVYAVCWDADGNRCFSSSREGEIVYWEYETSFKICEAKIEAVALSVGLDRKGLLGAVGADDCNLYLVNLKSTKKDKQSQLITLEGHTGKVYAANFPVGDDKVLSASMDGTCRLWDCETHTLLRSVKCHNAPIFNAKCSEKHPSVFLTASDDKSLKLHDLRVNSGAGSPGASPRSGGSASLLDLGEAPVSNPSFPTQVAKFKGHERTLWTCDFRYDEQQLVSSGMDAKVLFWDVRAPSSALDRFAPHHYAVHHVEYMPEGDTILTASRDRSWKLVDCKTGAVYIACHAHEGNCFRALYNAKTGLVMTCSSDTTIKFWNMLPT